MSMKSYGNCMENYMKNGYELYKKIGMKLYGNWYEIIWKLYRNYMKKVI